MDHSPRSPWPTDVATAAATGVATTLLSSHRWSRRAQWRLHGGFGALAAAATVAGVWRHEREEGGATPSVATVAAIAAATGLLTAGVSRGGQGGDAWVERTLAARGVRRPRLWMGAGAAGASLVMSLAERRWGPASGAAPDRALDPSLDGVDDRG